MNMHRTAEEIAETVAPEVRAVLPLLESLTTSDLRMVVALGIAQAMRLGGDVQAMVGALPSLADVLRAKLKELPP